MRKNKHVLLALLTGIFGMLFGMIFSQFFPVQSILAHDITQHQKLLAAEEFCLVDMSGNVRVSLKVDEKDEFSLSLYDKGGKHLGAFGLSPEGRTSITLGGKPKKR